MEINLTIKDVADYVDGELVGDATVLISGLNSLNEAKSGDLSFLSDKTFTRQFYSTKASAVIVRKDVVSADHNLIRVVDPDTAFNTVVKKIMPSPRHPDPGIHSTAVIHETAEIDDSVSIGPYCVIEEGVKIRSNTVLHAHVFVDRNSTIGHRSIIWPMVSIREECHIGDDVLIHSGVVIGFDGFGFNNVQGIWNKVPQLGNVIIGNNVELAASVTIARARFKSTIIGDGVKIDASTQIGHGAKIGKNSYVGAQSGFGGSCKIGDYVTIAPHSGVAPSTEVCPQVLLAARSVVLKDIKEKGSYWGMPAVPHIQEKRRLVYLKKLPALYDEVKMLRKKIETLEKSKNDK